MTASRFIKAMHPKTSIPPLREAVKKVLDAGWWAQTKINGHRVQLHISSNTSTPIISYTRQGSTHKKSLPATAVSELRRLFLPETGWHVLDAEWDKSDDRIYVFDCLKFNGRLLDSSPFQERFALLPRVYSSAVFETLPIIRSVDRCMDVLASTDKKIEGLVFKSPTTEGFADSSIVRCIAPAHSQNP